MIDGEMQYLGKACGRDWYWAGERFAKPGLYSWDNTQNVHLDDLFAERQQLRDQSDAKDARIKALEKALDYYTEYYDDGYNAKQALAARPGSET